MLPGRRAIFIASARTETTASLGGGVALGVAGVVTVAAGPAVAKGVALVNSGC